MIHLSPPSQYPSDIEALQAAYESGWIAPAGPALQEFERALCDYLGAEAAVAVSSGSAGLELSLRVLGIQPGDSVVVPTATFAATAFAAMHVGATPVFCGVSSDTWGLDPAAFESCITAGAEKGRPVRAVIPVDLYGHFPDYETINEIAQSHDIAVVEDAAEALGSHSSTGVAGSFGDLGVFSFNGNKIITTSGGGAVVGPAELVEKVRFLSTQAREAKMFYEHREIGHNYRLSNLLAALGTSQLSHIEEKVQRRSEIIATYESEIESFSPLQSTTDRPNNWLAVGMLAGDSDPLKICESLLENDVEARPAWKPMHRQPAFASVPHFGDDTADRLYERGICLPSGDQMTAEEVEFVVDCVKSALHER